MKISDLEYLRISEIAVAKNCITESVLFTSKFIIERWKLIVLDET